MTAESLLNNKLILVVDDEQDVLDLVALFLSVSETASHVVRQTCTPPLLFF